ncbi:CU044_5270 family protein [Actinomadura sp. 7K507]|uniref:CU044_5270 family protein n=1 Tax=Actinomadura sp. 7K507 TaxID=2530365 RepID=UPI0010467F8F|nr:CU044_5270 family protein [Actinomadura sp. 7K507]TDC95683.1 hypothetical protein E1285_06585 [Actinomadura sp. 7K507]
MSEVLRTLREARPAELHPDVPVDGDVRRMELARAMAAGPGTAAPRTEAPGKPVRRRVRPMWGLGLAGAVAAGAVVAATLVSPGEPASGDGAGPGEALDAKTILLAAAEKADGQTDTMRAYWHGVAIVSRTYMTGSAGARYAIVTRDKSEIWRPGKKGVKARERSQYLGAKPATMADLVAWRRAGSPDEFKVTTTTGAGATKPHTVKAAPGPVTRRPAPDGGHWPLLIPQNLTVEDLRSLPSDTEGLKAQLMRWRESIRIESLGRPLGIDEWLYQVGRGLVMFMPVRPEVRAAGFRMLAALPSVKSIGEAEDPRGRKGNAIAVDERTPSGVIRHQLIIDPSTGTGLASENIMLKPAAGVELPAGWKLDSTAMVGAEWTDSPPR